MRKIINELYLKEINMPYLNIVIKLYLAIFGLPLLAKKLRHEHARKLSPDEMNGMRLLDVGCTLGDFALNLSQKAEEVVGVDLVDRMDETRRIVEKNKLNVKLVAKNIFDLEYEDYFHGVYALDFFEHIDDDVALANCLNKYMIKNGFLIVAVPSIFRKIDEKFENEIGHVRNGYSKESLQQLLDQAGFRVEESYYVDRYDFVYVSYHVTKNVIIKMIFFPFFYFLSRNKLDNKKTGAMLLCKAVKK